MITQLLELALVTSYPPLSDTFTQQNTKISIAQAIEIQVNDFVMVLTPYRNRN